MTSPLKGKIFLADERGCNETHWYRSYRTFNFENYLSEHKKPFGDLHVLNDETLAAGKHVQIEVEEETYVLLLPVVGTISCKVDNYSEWLINPGQSFISHQTKNSSLGVSNLYPDKLINFLQIRCKASNYTKNRKQEIFSFDLDKNKNMLLPVTPASMANETEVLLPLVSMGKFGGRQDGVYQLKKPESSLFVFVIEGVFEVQGRLLHSRDGLGLSKEAQEIDLEALSSDAIIMVLEID